MTSITSENLLAVALVINRSRDGPAFVFHYPANVQPVIDRGHESADARASSSSAADVVEDSLLERLSQPAVEATAAPTDGNPSGSVSGSTVSKLLHRHHDDRVLTVMAAESAAQTPPWEHVAGFPTRDLASILTPARSFDKTLFRLSLDPLHCISYPIHVPENGKWKRAKRVHKDKAPSTVKLADEQPMAPHETESQVAPTVVISTDEPKDAKEGKKDDVVDEEKRSSMTMFNLVFLLNPKKSERRELTDLLYHNVVKKVNKAYKYSQQHSDFIWKESKRILAAKDVAREDQKSMNVLWKELLQTSSLAASIHDIYDAISQNKIATLHLDTSAGALTPSVQIPAPFFVSDLPAEHEESQRGLWLTTANAFLSQDALEEPGFLDRNFALLLMDDEKKIITELQADRDPTTVSMIEFARLAKPTMSFHQVGQSNVLTLGQVRKYAQHFIFWRRAIAIPPLHARDVYVVSPNCDLTRLAQDTMDWQRTFPLAPPLPNFLSELSASPRPFKTFCPSKAHRPLYLRMLAWLVRAGWATQLCTFAYVVVWPEIMYEVEYEIEAEELAAAAEEQRSKEQGGSPSPASSPPPSPTQTPHHDEASTAQHVAEQARLHRIALKASLQAADKVTSHARKTPPIPTRHPSTNDAPHLANLTPHIILDAKKATGKESRYLSAIAHRFRDDKVRSAWQAMCKYFDGRCVLERVALQENMKKKEAWVLLTAMSEYLLCTRHW